MTIPTGTGKRILFFLFLTLLIFTGIRQISCQPSRSPQIIESFTPVEFSDTLQVSSYTEAPGQPLQPSEFLASLDYSWIDQMVYPPNTTDLECYGHWKIRIDKEFEAFLVEVRQFWFVFKYLLVYSKAEQQFVSLLPLAQFYGGEGGQIRTESWLFDWDEDHSPKILSRRSEHSLFLSGGKMTKQYDESVSLQQWRKSKFQSQTI